MEIRPLQSFREVVREGSFTAAARNLKMTQPAISLHVKALEDELNTRILDRDGRGVRLTEAGTLLLEAVETVLSTLDDTARRIRESAAPERGRVVIACGDTVALHLLPPVLTTFRRLRPQAEVTIQNHASQQILDLVLRRQADVGIVTRPPWVDPALWIRTILVEPMRWAAWNKHPLAAGGETPVTAREIDGSPAVLLAKGAETRSLTDRGLRTLGARVSVVMESGNLEVVKAYVASGLGISFLPEMAITSRDRQKMTIRPLPPGFPERKIAVVRRKDRAPSPLAMDLLRLLSEHFRGVPDEDRSMSG